MDVMRRRAIGVNEQTTGVVPCESEPWAEPIGPTYVIMRGIRDPNNRSAITAL